MKRLVILIFVMELFQRSSWINRLRRKQSEKLRLNYKTQIHTGRIKIRNINKLEIADLYIERQGGSIRIERVLLVVNYFKAIRTWSLLKSLKVRLTTVDIELIRKNSGNSKQQSPITAMNAVQGFEKKFYTAYRSLTLLFASYMPQKISIEELGIEIRQFGIYAAFRSFNYSGGAFSSELDLTFRNKCAKLAASGQIDRENALLELYSRPVPVNNTIYSQLFSIENISIHFKQARDDSKKMYGINMHVGINGMRIHHPAISAEDFLVGAAALECTINFSNSSFMIADDSCGHVNEIPFSLYFSHDERETDIIRFVFLMDVNPVKLMQLLPGLSIFTGKNLGISGNLTLKFTLMFMINNPYEYFFNIDILENNIVIGNSQDLNLSYLKGSFFHDIRKNGNFRRRIFLDEALNENYCKLKALPPNFPALAVFAEDPGFYDHKGIDVFFVGYAIVTNIVTRKFTRGGSTITMQLVRNLFLNHEKNLVRKVEEIIIALLIENIFQIPKKRLLEIYLNVIEFGPDIYGIKEASTYYFNKLPSEMTISECIIITYIIPRPIHFYEALKLKTSQLNNNLENHMHRMATGLLANAIIGQNEYDTVMKIISEKSMFSCFCIPCFNVQDMASDQV